MIRCFVCGVRARARRMIVFYACVLRVGGTVSLAALHWFDDDSVAAVAAGPQAIQERRLAQPTPACVRARVQCA